MNVLMRTRRELVSPCFGSIHSKLHTFMRGEVGSDDQHQIRELNAKVEGRAARDSHDWCMLLHRMSVLRLLQRMQV